SGGDRNVASCACLRAGRVISLCCCACCDRHRPASPDPRKKHGQICSLQGNRDLWVPIAREVGSGRAYKRGLHASNLVLLNSGIDHSSCKIRGQGLPCSVCGIGCHARIYECFRTYQGRSVCCALHLCPCDIQRDHIDRQCGHCDDCNDGDRNQHNRLA